MSGNRNILNAYESMFEDGSAYKPIQIKQETPTVSSAEGKGGGEPLGNILENNNRNDDDGEPDFSEFDRRMAKRVNGIRSRINEGGSNGSSEEIMELKNRVKLLEQALAMIMATQTKLIEGK